MAAGARALWGAELAGLKEGTRSPDRTHPGLLGLQGLPGVAGEGPSGRTPGLRAGRGCREGPARGLTDRACAFRISG